MPKQADDGELDHVVVESWEVIQARQDAWENSGPCDSGDDLAMSIRTEARTAVFRDADDDRAIAAAQKGAPTSCMVCAIQFEQAGQFKFEEVRLGESVSARFGMDAQNAVDV